MKTNKFGLLTAAGLASAFAVASPALAHDGHWDGRHFYPGHRVIVRPVFAPAPGDAPNAVGTIGGAIAGAAIGAVASHGRPGAIAAGTVLGAVVGSTLPR